MVKKWLLPLFLLTWTCQLTTGFLPNPRRQDPEEHQVNNIVPSARRLPLLRSSLTNHLTAITIAGVIGFATDPLVETIFNVTHVENVGESFQETFLFGAADSIALGARAWGGVVVVDLVTRKLLDLHLPVIGDGVDLFQAAPMIGFTIWAGLTVSTIKRTVFKQMVSGSKLGRVGLYDKLIDFLLSLGVTANILSILDIDIGMGFQSIFAASGVSALVFSLASKGLVEQIVAGFVVQAWDAIEEGEYVKLGDGTEGTVETIGLAETHLMGSDNISVRIPNSQLAGQRVSNLSRMTRTQVKQILRFKYSDLDKLPMILGDIKSVIQANCPKLITDGSKPFQALLTRYEADHVEAVINCHFDIEPASGESAEMRQKVMLSIAEAVKRNGIEFAIPSIFYRTGEGGPPS